MTDRICVAQIGAPHGVRGEVRLRSFTEDPLAFVEYGPLESEDRKQRFSESQIDMIAGVCTWHAQNDAAHAEVERRLFGGETMARAVNAITEAYVVLTRPPPLN